MFLNLSESSRWEPISPSLALEGITSAAAVGEALGLFLLLFFWMDMPAVALCLSVNRFQPDFGDLLLL